MHKKYLPNEHLFLKQKKISQQTRSSWNILNLMKDIYEKQSYQIYLMVKYWMFSP